MKVAGFVLSVSFFAASAGAVKPSFVCDSIDEARIEHHIVFRAAVPTLTESFITKDSQGTVIEENIDSILSPTEVCGVPIDFAKSCRINQVTQGNDFNVSFRCGKVYGDIFYLDQSGYSEFRCLGAAPEKFRHRVFERCHLQAIR